MLKSQQSTPTRRPIAAGLILAALAVAFLAGSALAASNLVKNGSFEKDSDGDGIPNNWLGNNLTLADKRVCKQSYDGSCSLKMTGDGTVKFLYQDVYSTPGGIGESYKLTFYMKGKAINQGGFDLFRVQFVILHEDGNSFDSLEQVVPQGNSPWAKYSINLTSTEVYEGVRVRIFQEGGPSGKLWIDKINVKEIP